MKTQSGFILPSQGMLIAGAILIGLLALQTWRLDRLQTQHAEFVAGVKVLGEAAQKQKELTEATHAKVFKETKDGYEKNLKSGISVATANFVRKYPGKCAVSQTPNNPQGTDVTASEPLACDSRFVTDCAADVVKINSWQSWAAKIGFPVE